MVATLYLPSGEPYRDTNAHPDDPLWSDSPQGATRQLGGVGLHEFSGYLSEEFLAELTGRRGAEYFEQMRRNDSAMGTIAMSVSMLIRSSQHSLSLPLPKKQRKPAHKKAIKFYQEVLEDMEGKPEDWIQDATTAIWHGFSLDEITFKWRDGNNSEYHDGKLGIASVDPRRQTSLENWDFDDREKAVGYWHHPRYGAMQVWIPLAKSLHFRTSREGNNPEGYSFFRNSVRSYKQLNVVQYSEGIGAERNLAGLPMVQMPVGATSDADYTRARNLVEKARRDEYAGIILPPPRAPGEDFKWKFDLIAPLSRGAMLDTNAIISRLHGEMLTSMLINFLSFGGSGSSGQGYAAGRVQGDFFQTAISGLLADWEWEINEKISKKLFRYNQFPGVKQNEYPIIKFSPISQRNMDTVRNLLRDMSSVGFIDNEGPDIENWLRGQLDLPSITREEWDERQKQIQIESQKALAQQQEMASISATTQQVNAPLASTTKGLPKPKDKSAKPNATKTQVGRDQKGAVSAKRADGPTAGMK
jgi:hypothetical protein